MVDNSYRLVIKTTLNGQQTIIEFDTVNPPSINGSSQLTEQPMVNGDIISDHMYKEPITVPLSGSFSIYGNKPTVFRGKGDRLTNVQDTFEKIKDEGVFCTLVTLRRDRNYVQRYKARQNMVLKSFTWTENQSSVDFNFTFQQVLLARLNIAIPMYDVNDNRLPDLTDATILNFTDEVIRYEDIVKVIVSELVANDLIINYTQFLQGIASYALQNLPAEQTKSEKTIGKVGLNVLTSLGAIALGGPIAGLLTGVGGAVTEINWGIGIGESIAMVFKSFKTKYNISKYQTKPFKYIEGNDDHNQAEYDRFIQYVSMVKAKLDECIGNNNMKLYGCSENKPQSCIIFIDDDYYTFTFTVNNTSNAINLRVTNTDDVIMYDAQIQPLRGIGDCVSGASGNSILITKSGYEVYVLNPYLYDLEQNWGSEEEYIKVYQDISKYRVLVSTKKVSDLVTNLNDIIIENMIGD